MKKSMLKLVFAALGLVGVVVSAPAQESPWLVRVRAVHIDPADKSDPVGGAGASDRLHVSAKWIPRRRHLVFLYPELGRGTRPHLSAKA